MKDPADQNAEDIRSLNATIRQLSGDLRANNERTDRSLAEVQDARTELQGHIQECTEANKAQDTKLWCLLIAAAAFLGERFWTYLGAAL